MLSLYPSYRYDLMPQLMVTFHRYMSKFRALALKRNSSQARAKVTRQKWGVINFIAPTTTLPATNSASLHEYPRSFRSCSFYPAWYMKPSGREWWRSLWSLSCLQCPSYDYACPLLYSWLIFIAASNPCGNCWVSNIVSYSLMCTSSQWNTFPNVQGCGTLALQMFAVKQWSI